MHDGVRDQKLGHDIGTVVQKTGSHIILQRLVTTDQVTRSKEALISRESRRWKGWKHTWYRASGGVSEAIASCKIVVNSLDVCMTVWLEAVFGLSGTIKIRTTFNAMTVLSTRCIVQTAPVGPTLKRLAFSPSGTLVTLRIAGKASSSPDSRKKFYHGEWTDLERRAWKGT